MQQTWLYTLSSVVAVSLVSFAGLVSLAANPLRMQQIVFLLVSLAVGAMFGDAFIHLLPQAFRSTEHPVATSLSVLSGLLLFFLLEKFLLWRHEHTPHDEGCVHPAGYMNLVSDALHNLIDGVLIASSYLVSVPIGVATTVAVLLHEIPQEIGDFGVLLHSGFRPVKALWLNFLCATFGIGGAVLTLVAGSGMRSLPEVLVPLTAGGFIYIAGSDLVPELHKEREPLKSLFQLLAIGLGVGLMLLLILLE